MGVPIEIWVKVVNDNPLKFRFKGLDGYHETLGEAFANDRYYMQNLINEEIEFQMLEYEDYDPEYDDFSHIYDMVQDRGYWEQELAKYPPVEVYDAAAQQGFPIEDVWFICPSCGQHPVYHEPEYGTTSTYYHCGLCGAESALNEDAHMGHLLEDLGATNWPFIPGEDVRLNEPGATYKGLLVQGRKAVWKNGGLHERVPT